jgi:hypothetical protein
MKTQYISGRRAGFVFAILCAFGLTLGASGTAQAQYRQDRDNDRDRRESNRDWRRDRRDRDRDRDRDRSDVYDRNHNGIDDRYEQRGNVYDRNGNGVDDRYERGNVYGNNGGYGNRGGYGNYGYDIAQVATDQGYQDGLNTGASDGQRGQNYDPQRSHYYKSANDGYNSAYGNRSTYQQYYRNGFLQGYQQGYRQYGNGRYGRNYPTSRAGSILGNIFGRP